MSTQARAPRTVLMVLVCLLGVVAGSLLIAHARGQVRVTALAAPLPTGTFSEPSTAVQPPVRRAAIGQPAPAPASGCAPRLATASVLIPALCIEGSIVPTSRDATGALAIPADVHHVAIWAEGAAVDATSGTTLLAGHVDYAGQGAGSLYRLYRVQPGDVVYLTDVAGTVTAWRIVALSVVVKNQLPGSVFAGRAGPRRLVIVTCGGPVEQAAGYGNTYRDNVIATAVPAPTELGR